MATAGFERGVLRLPARFRAPRSVSSILSPSPGEPDRDPSIATGAEGLDGRRGTTSRAITPWAGCRRYCRCGGEHQQDLLVRVDLQMHETAMRSRVPRRARRRSRCTTGEGFLFAQAGPIYAGTNEIRATSLPSAMPACRSPERGRPSGSFSPNTRSLRDSVSRFLMNEASPELLGEIWETGGCRANCAPSSPRRRHGLSVPEEFGGLGLGDVDRALVMESWLLRDPDSLVDRPISRPCSARGSAGAGAARGVVAESGRRHRAPAIEHPVSRRRRHLATGAGICAAPRRARVARCPARAYSTPRWRASMIAPAFGAAASSTLRPASRTGPWRRSAGRR